MAQSALAVVEGRITNQATGLPIRQALVIARHLQTNIQSYRYTNEHGLYYFSALPPGAYAVRADALGFQPEERSAVELSVASHTELNFALPPSPPGTATPQGLVPAPRQTRPQNILLTMYGSDAAIPQALLSALPTPPTETLVGSVSSLIDARKISELPLSGRDVYTLLVLQPGVTSDNATARGLGFSVNGQRVSSSNYLLDGADNNDLLITGPATLVSAEAIQEYRVATNNLSAEFGRSSGFVANAITRSGGNALHGTVYEFFNHDRLNANSFAYNWEGVRRPPLRQNQYGASVGGPMRRDRLFFFANFEQAQTSSESRPSEVVVPTAALVSLLPPGSQAKRLLTEYPPPSGEPLPDTPFFALKRFVLPVAQRNTFGLGRADYASLASSHRVSVRYAVSRQTTENFFFSVYEGLNAPLEVNSQSVAVNYTSELAGGSNELQFGAIRSDTGARRADPGLPGILFPPAFSALSLPGMESNFDYSSRGSLFHLAESHGRLAGKHAFKVGSELRLGFTDSFYSVFRNGQYSFDTLDDFLFPPERPSTLVIPLNRETGLPGSEDDYRRYYRQVEWAAFVQDNLKLTPRLTLNLGVRYEHFGVPAPRKTTRDSNFIFGDGRTVEERIAAGRLETGPLYRPDRNNFAPRFGFALDLTGDGRSVLRGGFGVLFDRIFNNIWLDARNNNLPVQCLQASAGQPRCNIPPTQARIAFAIPASQGIGALRPEAVRNNSTVALDRRLRTPYSQTWCVGWQQELTPNLVLEVNQVGSLGRKLIARDMLNRGGSLERTPLLNPYGRFNPEHAEIGYHGNQGHSDHLALQMGLNRRWSRGVQFQVSYSYSRTNDVQSDPFVGPGSAGDPTSRLASSSLSSVPGFVRQFDPGASYGKSDFDQTHSLVLNFIAQAPPFPGWRGLFGSWQAAGLAGIRSGFPFSVISLPARYPGERRISTRADFIGDRRSDAFLAEKPEVPGGVLLLDSTQFRAPAEGQLGDISRNAFRGPGFWNVDFALSRSFPLRRLGEQWQLQARMEVFNLFNHANLNNPDSLLESPFFGEAVFGRTGFGSALPSVSPLDERPRRIQVAVKVLF
ncbi:MAG: TonB-dependent receptor domain-containing protein [Terriglobia bacterium]